MSKENTGKVANLLKAQNSEATAVEKVTVTRIMHKPYLGIGVFEKYDKDLPVQ